MATHEENKNLNPNPSLHEDLIYDILSRLAVKTLLRFKSVCKSWLSMISSSSFIKTHLSKSTSDPCYTHHGLLLCYWNHSHRLGIFMDPKTCSLYSLFEKSNTGVVCEILDESESEDDSYSLFHESNTRVVREMLDESEDDSLYSLFHESNAMVVGEIIDESEDDFFTYMAWRIVRDDKEFDIADQSDIRIRDVVGCCNGLVCLACNMGVCDLYLWNPATRNIRKLPNLEAPYFHESCCGFCYDELNDTFKIYSVYESNNCRYEVSVYSSKSDCWRLIGGFPSENHDEGFYVKKSPAIFANGLLHWVILGDRRSYEESSIISLDISTEILLPKYREEEKGKCIRKFGNFSNSLSLFCKFDDRVDLWICGVEELWTKLFTIPYMDTLNGYLDIKPICVSVNGDIMLLYNYRTIVLYNSKDSTFYELLKMSFGQHVFTYVESLVSP